jgi:hypothetical protein
LAELQFAKLNYAMDRFHVMEILEALPKDLNATYERVLNHISEKLRADAIGLLRWIGQAQPSLEEAKIEESRILRLCRDKGSQNVADASQERREGIVWTLEPI